MLSRQHGQWRPLNPTQHEAQDACMDSRSRAGEQTACITLAMESCGALNMSRCTLAYNHAKQPSKQMPQMGVRRKGGKGMHRCNRIAMWHVAGACTVAAWAAEQMPRKKGHVGCVC